MDPTVAAMTKRNELRMVDSLMSQEFTAQVGEFHTNQMVHLNRHEHVAIILHYAKERAKKEGHGVQRNKIIAEEDTVDDELDPVQKHLNDLLNEATKKGDIEMLEHRIDEGAHVNAHDEDEWTPLHWAAEHHKEEAALALLRHGAKPNAVTDLDQTPLHFAAKFNAPGMIHALIEHGADVDAKDENERTALDISSEYGWEEVHDIIEAAVNQKRKDENLISAAENGDDGGVEDVLASGADVHTVDKEKCWTALHWAASQGRPHMMEILLDYKSDPNAVDNEGCTPLHIVAETDKVNLATLLLKKGAQLEARDRVLMTPLHRSVQKGIDDMVQLFVERNADVNAKDRVGRTPLHLAAKEGHESASGEGWVGSDGDGIVSLLLSRGVHVDELDRGLRTPLHWAAAGGHDDVVKLLLGNQATGDLRDRKGMFASDLAVQKGHDSAAAPIKAAMAQKTRNISLLDAARQGDKSLVTDMLEEGAEVNFKDTKSRSALQLATRNGHETVVRAVLDVQSCDVDSRNDIGHTSLHLACAGGYSVIARMLLDRGADVEAQDPKDGWTPLFEAVYAATDAHVEVVQVLLRGGALLKAVSTNGLQPIHLASECGHEGMLKFLLDHGKDYCADYDLVSATTAVSQWEPLSFAAEKGRLGAVYALIKHGANVNAVTRHRKQTPLHLACLFHQFDCVKLLVDAGCNVNVKDWKNMPPIIYAMDQEEGPSIKDFLIEHGSVQINYDWMMGNMGMMEFDLGNGISGFLRANPNFPT